MTLFGTAGIRGSVTDDVTPELAVAVGQAIGVDARDRDPDPGVVVGRDGRVTGEALAGAVAAGVQSVGVPVTRIGQVPTPALAWATRSRRGVMVTASHNPPADNGLKLFVDGVEYDSDAETRIENRLQAGVDPTAWETWASASDADVLAGYRESVLAYARTHGTSLEDLAIVVDCGNGTASLSTPQILTALGADVVTLHGNVDGRFPGRTSKPTRTALSGCRRFLADNGFDLGVAHDGDGDRIVVLDGDGEIIHEDTVLAILARHLVDAASVDDPVVVTTPNASARIDDQVTAAGGRVVRTALGTLHEAVARHHDTGETVVFAAEPWKHLHPDLGGWIDGAASAALFARLTAAEGLATLRAPVPERPYRKQSVDCPEAAKRPVMDRVASDLPARFDDAAVSTEFGVRVTRPDGSWVLVRPSGTEPKIRIYVEAEDVDPLLEAVETLVTDIVADVA